MVVDAFQMACPPEKREEAKIMAALNQENLYNFAGFLPGSEVSLLFLLACIYIQTI